MKKQSIKTRLGKRVYLVGFLLPLLMVGCGKDNNSNNNNTVNGYGVVGCPGCSENNKLYSAIGRSGTGIEMDARFYVMGVDSTLNQNCTAQTPQYCNGNSYANGYYTGSGSSIGIQGNLYVQNGSLTSSAYSGYYGYGNTTNQSCSIPVGTYSLNMIQAGSSTGDIYGISNNNTLSGYNNYGYGYNNYGYGTTGYDSNSGVVSNIVVEANGPVKLHLRLTQSVFSLLTPQQLACDGQWYSVQMTYAQWVVEDVNGYPCGNNTITLQGAQGARQCY